MRQVTITCDRCGSVEIVEKKEFRVRVYQWDALKPGKGDYSVIRRLDLCGDCLARFDDFMEEKR